MISFEVNTLGSGFPGACKGYLVAGFLLLWLVLLTPVAAAQNSPPVEYYRLAPGFLPENKNENGYAIGSGFAGENPWGAYTAYLMATNAKGQRTWRIENYMQMANMTQGSTIYLAEGSERALLIDTGQNTPEVAGKNDLKTVVHHLLGHNNDGTAKSNPVDFTVAISHRHGDHTGKLAQMDDRTVYFPDLDWPADAKPNYVPIKEGGGETTHGQGKAVGEIQLGGRTIRVINIHGHTPGSVGFLDVENNMIFTSDAIGSGCVWAHFGPVKTYADSLRHLQEVLRPLNNPAILPGHFYQISAGARGKPPLNGKPLDKQYVDDQLTLATGVLNGTIKGEPYPTAGKDVLIARFGSAEMTYRLSGLGTETATPK